MNIIDKLHELITPRVLDLVSHYVGDNASKKDLLTSVYGILGARLSDSATVKRVENLVEREPEAIHNGAKLLDAVLQDEHGNPQASLLSSELAKEHNLPESTATAMLATTTPMVLGHLKELAGEGGLVGFLKDKLGDLAQYVPAWAAALLPAGLLASIAGFASSLKTGAGNAVSDIASGAGNAISGLASGASHFAGKAVSGVSGVASDVADGTKDAVGAVADGGKAVLGATVGAVGAAAGVAGAVASGVLGGAKDAVGAVAGGTKGAVSTVADGAKDVAGAVVDTGKDAVGAVADGGKAVLGATVGAVGAAAGVAGAVASGVLGGAKDVAGSVATGAKDVAGSVATGAKDVAGTVANSAKDVAHTTKDAVGAVATGAKDAVGGAVTGVSNVASNTAKAGGGFLKSLLPIIGLIILAGLAWLLLRGCQDNKTPVAAPVAKPTAEATTDAKAVENPNAVPATLSLATDDKGNALYSCRGEAGNEGVFASIRTALSGVFGVADKCELNVSDKHAGKLAIADDKLAGLFGLLKGVPNASININDKTVRFNATNDADVAKLVDGAKALLGEGFTVEAEPKLDTAAAVTSSIDTAKTAIEGLGENTDAKELVRALNMQIINFATSSNAIPDANKEILDLASKKLASLPEARLKITGHTDSQGNHASNQKLSERRAAAVRDYLVSKGVSKDNLEIFGASSDEPVASNATEQGRFQNRRIEFTLVEKDGTVTAIGNAENSQAVANTETKDAKAEQPAPATDAKEEAKPAQ